MDVQAASGGAAIEQDRAAGSLRSRPMAPLSELPPRRAEFPVTPILLEGPDVRLELLPLGATLRRFEVRLAHGSWRNLVLGSGQVADYLRANLYLGATVGRFANRIANGRLVLGKEAHELDVNESPNHLHGGSDGFHAKVWEVSSEGLDWVELALVSADGDPGYPGTVNGG